MKWNRGSTKKLLRVKVTSHESELEFDISPKSTGKYLFDLVCSTIGLRETWYFGLQSYTILPSGKMKFSHWLKLDKKIISQKPHGCQSQLCFFFHTKFFPEDIEQELIQATTRHLFYLSVKAKILSRNESTGSGNSSGDLCPSMDVAVLLASLAAQAEFGDVCDDDLDGKDDPVVLPNRLLRLVPKQLIPQIQSDQSLAQKLKDCYKSYRGINRDKAELQYLKVAQLHHLFGVDYFPIICVRMKCPRALSLARYFSRNDLSPWRSWNKHFTNAWLGVTAAGMQLCGQRNGQREQPRFMFQWNIIKNVSYRERKFTIKLIGTWRCCTNSNNTGTTPVVAAPTTSNETAEKTAGSHRTRQSSRSVSGRSPLFSSGVVTTPTNLTVTTCGTYGSGTSAASLPSTPLSVRLALPVVHSVGTESSPVAPTVQTSGSSPRVHRDSSYDRASRRRKNSPTVIKISGRMFEFESGCVSGLIPGSSVCSASELPGVGTIGGCLSAHRAQTTDSSGAASSTSSSKGSFPPLPNCSVVADHLISVIEVWLADPTQAKTVMSMCAGNHALFMCRRQPDSVEVQQMRAQAREERARREIERSRLARARAEKAEALEAKVALESRCAQLEQALQRQHDLQHALLSGRVVSGHGVKHPDEDDERVVASSHKSPGPRASRRFPMGVESAHMLHPENDRYFAYLGTETGTAGKPDENGPLENDSTSDTVHKMVDNNRSPEMQSRKCSLSTVSRQPLSTEVLWSSARCPQYCPPIPPGHFSRADELRSMACGAGSNSTPVTPYAKRAIHFQTPNFKPFVHRGNPMVPSDMNALFDGAHSVACAVCSESNSRHFRTGAIGFNPARVPQHPSAAAFHVPEICPTCERVSHGSCLPGIESTAVYPYAPNSMPALHNELPVVATDDVVLHPPFKQPSRKPSQTAGHACAPHRMVHPPFFSGATALDMPVTHDPIVATERPRRRRWNGLETDPLNAWECQENFAPPWSHSTQAHRTPIPTSLSAILSPVAAHRWHHAQSRKQLGDENTMHYVSPSALSKHTCHRSAPFLLQCGNPIAMNSLYNPIVDSPTTQMEWPQPSDSVNHGYSLQYLPLSSACMSQIPNPDDCLAAVRAGG